MHVIVLEQPKFVTARGDQMEFLNTSPNASPSDVDANPPCLICLGGGKVRLADSLHCRH